MGRILFGFCTLSSAMIMAAVMVFFNNLPNIMRLFLQLARQVMFIFYLLYQSILSKLHQITKYKINFDPLENPYRTIACIFLSIIFYLLYLLVFRKGFSLWITGCAVLHGYLIGSLWKDFFEPGGLNLGDPLW